MGLNEIYFSYIATISLDGSSEEKALTIFGDFFKLLRPPLNINTSSNFEYSPKLITPYSKSHKILFYRLKAICNKYRIPLNCTYKKGNKSLKSIYQKKF